MRLRRALLATAGFCFLLAGLAWAQNTVVLLNTQYNAESTGNVLTAPAKIWLAAGYCQNATAVTSWGLPTSNPAVAACDTGTNTQKGTLDFADGANSLSAQTVFHLPTDFTSTVDARIYWYSATTSGNVVWQVATICVADAETADPAFNTASTVTDAAKGSASQYNTAAITGVTITGCAAGEVLYLKLFRDPAHASDTMAGTARLVGLELTYRRAM